LLLPLRISIFKPMLNLQLPHPKYGPELLVSTSSPNA
jgi:hypothetical protein